MKNITFDIITVNFNDEQGLRDTLLSVHQQDYPHYNHIVIDGNSSDGSCLLLKNFRSDNLHYISESDNGIYFAMNKGLFYAKSDFTLFLNAGDMLQSTHSLSIIANHISDINSIYIFSTAIYKDQKRVSTRPFSFFNFLFPFFIQLPPHSSILFPKAFYSVNLYDTSLRFASDSDYKIRALLSYPSSLFSSVVLSKFFLGGLSNSCFSFRSIISRFYESLFVKFKHYNFLVFLLSSFVSLFLFIKSLFKWFIIRLKSV